MTIEIFATPPGARGKHEMLGWGLGGGGGGGGWGGEWKCVIFPDELMMCQGHRGKPPSDFS